MFAPGPKYWKLEGVGDPGGLLVWLTDILPAGSTLYVEGTRSPIVTAYLAERPAADPLAVAAGTIWPRPEVHHMPMTPENVAGLAELMERIAAPELGDHLHAYRGSTASLIWYDFPDDPLYVTRDVPEAELQRLCTALGGDYSPASA